MDNVLVVRTLSTMLLPPLNLLLLVALGGMFWVLGRKRIALALVTFSMVALAALSMPVVAFQLMKSLTAGLPFLGEPRATNAQAIVILGAGRRVNAREYGGGDQPSFYTMGRLRYGAWLHEQTGLPILVTGGSPERRPETEAAIMARSLHENFKVPVRWMEGESDNTEQNAKYSARILKEVGISRILLVSDAWHLPRALPMFVDQGLQAIAAPTNSMDADAMQGLFLWLPQAQALTVSQIALREWAGKAWYALRH
jgi:uncharacterized SAM-binding protein YcdF (DUF218 family)